MEAVSHHCQVMLHGLLIILQDTQYVEIIDFLWEGTIEIIECCCVRFVLAIKLFLDTCSMMSDYFGYWTLVQKIGVALLPQIVNCADGKMDNYVWD